MPEKGSDAIFVMLKFLSVWKSLSAHTFKRNFYIYKNGRETMICILQTVCPTAIFHFQFSTFNLKKLPLGHLRSRLETTVFTNRERRLAVHFQF